MVTFRVKVGPVRFPEELCGGQQQKKPRTNPRFFCFNNRRELPSTEIGRRGLKQVSEEEQGSVLDMLL